MKRRSSESGQAGLIVMLVMVVLLTLGVSIASRSTRDVSQSTQEAETSRVFDVAEAGIETALYTADSGALVATGESAYTVGDLSGSYTIDEISGLEVDLDESQVVKLDTSGYVGDIKIEWSKVSDCGLEDPASIVVSIFSSLDTVKRYAYEGCSGHSDSFLSSLAGTSPYAFETTITVDSDDDLVRIRPVYNGSFVKVTGIAANFPVQYHQISSKANNSVSGETRAIQVDRTLPAVPAIFDYVLFSGGTITKN